MNDSDSEYRPLGHVDRSVNGILQRLREKNRDWTPSAAIRPKRKKALEPGWLIGRTEDREDVSVPYRFLNESSTHIMGPSGFGKSYTMYNLICQTIRSGYGAILIDPAGSLYQMMLNFLIRRQIDPRRVVLINTQLSDWTPKLNPLQPGGGRNSPGIAVAGGALLLPTRDKNYDQMARLRTWVRASAGALEQAKLPLAVLPWFLSLVQDASHARREIVAELENPYFRLIWNNLEAMTRRDMFEHLGSTMYRAAAFAEDYRLRQMMASIDGNIDWRDVLDNQKIVLCNLGQDGQEPLERQHLQIIGGVIVHGLMAAANRRSVEQNKHCFLFCDEFSEYVNEDVARGLAQLRKRELHFVLAHQTINQVREYSPVLWSEIQSDCQVKIMFGGMGRPDAKEMAEEIFTGEVHGDNIKYEQRILSQRSQMQFMEIISLTEGGSEAWSEGSSDSDSYGTGGGRSATTGSGEAMSVLMVQDGIITPTITKTTSFQAATTEASNWLRSQVHTQSSSQTHSRNWGRTSTFAPFNVPEDYWQAPSLTYYSLEEEWEKRIALLKNLPKRRVALKVYSDPVIITPTLQIHDKVVPREQLLAFEQQVCEMCPYVCATAEAEDAFQSILAAEGLGDTTVIEAPTDFYNVGLISDLPGTDRDQRARTG